MRIQALALLTLIILVACGGYPAASRGSLVAGSYVLWAQPNDAATVQHRIGTDGSCLEVRYVRDSGANVGTCSLSRR